MYKVYSKFNFPFTSLVEVWKDVPEWEECYEASSFGRIRSKDKIRHKMRMGKPYPAFYKGRIRAHKIQHQGYCITHFRDCERSSHPSVHRVVALTFIVNPENKPTVNHRDGNKQNNNVTNLEWATQSEQTQHAFDTGLIKPRGAPIYSPEFKRKVYEYFIQTGCSIKELTRVFDISEKTASSISKKDLDRKGLKLTDEEVEEIKILRASGNTLKSISEKFGCGISQIHRITRGMSRNVQYERN